MPDSPSQLGEPLPLSPDLVAMMDPAAIVATRTVRGGAAPERVREHADSVRSAAAAGASWGRGRRARIEQAETLLVATARRLAAP